MNESVAGTALTSTEIRDLQASIDQAKLRRAAELTLSEKLRMGADLYDEGISWLRKVLQAEHPGWSPQEVEAELRRRRAIKKATEEQGLFFPVPPDSHEDSRDI